MLQDIEPHIFNNEYKWQKPKDEDYFISYNASSVLLNSSNDKLEIMRVRQVREINPVAIEKAIFLFKLDCVSVFSSFERVEESEAFKYIKISELRDIVSEWMYFAIATAGHLVSWYSTNKYCGRCGVKFDFSKTERALCCPKCGLIKYPTISPAIIVGITNGDKILLTRYANRPYKKLSLVAGFTEIGETLENTVKREVMEEVGLKVKNIKYYKSQPWAISQSVLVGFFAELDGSDSVKLDKSELAEANWFSRGEIPECETKLSLTNTMIEDFRTNNLNIRN